MSSAEVISLEKVSVTFGEDVVLQDVSISIGKGESYILVGPSGRGKSVLLKTMSGLIAPSGGQVKIEGSDWQQMDYKQKDSILSRMGVLFQKNALFDSLTVAENIAFPMRERTQMSEKDIQDKITFFLEETGIPHARDLYPDEISGGMQKRLGIARALAMDPEIVFYDDPTAGLDPITSRKIVELILRLQSEIGSTIVAITNDMNRAFQLAGRIAMVVDGGVIETGDEEQTMQHQDPRVVQFIRGQLEGPLTVVG